MAFRLVSPVKRSGSSQVYFAQRIPKAILHRARGLKLAVPVGPERVTVRISDSATTVRVSLRTADASVAKIRQAEVAAFFETFWQSLRTTKAISLTHRQCVALSGEIFRAWTADEGQTLEVERQPDGSLAFVEDTFTPAEGWQAALDHLSELGDDIEPEQLEGTFGPIIRSVLRSHGIAEVDRPSWAMLLREFRRALRDALLIQQRQANGDYAPSPAQDRFQRFEASGATPQVTAAKHSLVGLVDDWWAEAKPAGRTDKTHESYTATFKRFAKFVGHDDAQRVTAEDVVRFKAERLASGISPKTVKDSDIAGLKSVFGVAVANRVLVANPADGVKVIRAKPTRTRSKGFTPEEAAALLAASSAYVGTSREKPKTTAAKRWVPWLCAYTGARVGELAQLRKEDVRTDNGMSIITITPEAGTVKDKEAREVVLHAHLVEMGFLDFVAGSVGGHLFFNAKPGEGTRGKRTAT